MNDFTTPLPFVSLDCTDYLQMIRRNRGGGGLQARATANHETVYGLFGGSMDCSDFDKVKAQWCLRFADGKYVTIYDYKSNELPSQNTDWHIGGNDRTKAAWVAALLEGRAECSW